MEQDTEHVSVVWFKFQIQQPKLPLILGVSVIFLSQQPGVAFLLCLSLLPSFCKYLLGSTYYMLDTAERAGMVPTLMTVTVKVPLLSVAS